MHLNEVCIPACRLAVPAAGGNAGMAEMRRLAWRLGFGGEA